MSRISTALEAIGLVVLGLGFGLLAAWLGLALFGAGLILFGYALGESPRRPPVDE